MLLGRLLLVGGTLILVAGVGILFRGLVHHRPMRWGLILAPIGLLCVVLGFMQPNADYMATKAAGATALQQDLRKGQDLAGKTVTFKVAQVQKAAKWVRLTVSDQLVVRLERDNLSSSIDAGDRVTVECVKAQPGLITGRLR